MHISQVEVRIPALLLTQAAQSKTCDFLCLKTSAVPQRNLETCQWVVTSGTSDAGSSAMEDVQQLCRRDLILWCLLQLTVLQQVDQGTSAVCFDAFWFCTVLSCLISQLDSRWLPVHTGFKSVMDFTRTSSWPRMMRILVAGTNFLQTVILWRHLYPTVWPSIALLPLDNKTIPIPILKTQRKNIASANRRDPILPWRTQLSSLPVRRWSNALDPTTSVVTLDIWSKSQTNIL